MLNIEKEVVRKQGTTPHKLWKEISEKGGKEGGKKDGKKKEKRRTENGTV